MRSAVLRASSRRGCAPRSICAKAADLDALYGYLTLRLMHANRHNDEAALAECERLIEPLREAWQAIAPSATTR